jgi:hypothetical protein
MRLTNDAYLISISTKNWTERYYRTGKGWVKESARGRTFRHRRQVLNHVLPALAGVKPAHSDGGAPRVTAIRFSEAGQRPGHRQHRPTSGGDVVYLTDFESWHWWGGGLVSMTR